MTDRTPIFVDLEKAAGLFVGPRAGRWSNPEHSSTWKPAPASDRPMVKVKSLLKGNLGVPRIEMPQISAAKLPEFIQHLQAAGIAVHSETVPARTLKATQSELHADKIEKLLDDGFTRGKPVVVSRDSFLLDGHHQWAALRTRHRDHPVDVVRVGLPIRKLLTAAGDFGGVEYRKSATSEAADLLKGIGIFGGPRNQQSTSTGIADEVQWSIKGKKKRKRREGPSSMTAKPGSLDPLARPDERPEPHRMQASIDAAGDARLASEQAREHGEWITENARQRKRDNPPLVDHVRAMRLRDGSE